MAGGTSETPDTTAATDATYAGLVGRSAPMRDLFRMLERIRATSATILVTGENGTGKELVARAIHTQSARGHKRFVATNCGAFNDNLLESELFGHKRGSFTGAVGDKPGLFEVADGGTFFMDEVGDMSPALQVKLLRVLQEGVFLPVGATEPRQVDVRIIAATNRDLATMVQRGTFREDLFYRLHVVALRVPALRERPEDIPLLVAHFLDKLATRDKHQKVLAAGTRARLLAHRWPGNVRELENEIERLWVLAGDATVISEEHLSPAIARASRPPSADPCRTSQPSGQRDSYPGAARDSAPNTPRDSYPGAARDSSPGAPRDSYSEAPREPGTADDLFSMKLPAAVEALERRMIVDGLARARGNKTRAAEDLGISRRNLIRKVQALGLEVARGSAVDDETALDGSLDDAALDAAALDAAALDTATLEDATLDDSRESKP